MEQVVRTRAVVHQQTRRAVSVSCVRPLLPILRLIQPSTVYPLDIKSPHIISYHITLSHISSHYLTSSHTLLQQPVLDTLMSFITTTTIIIIIINTNQPTNQYTIHTMSGCGRTSIVIGTHSPCGPSNTHQVDIHTHGYIDR